MLMLMDGFVINVESVLYDAKGSLIKLHQCKFTHLMLTFIHTRPIRISFISVRPQSYFVKLKAMLTVRVCIVFQIMWLLKQRFVHVQTTQIQSQNLNFTTVQIKSEVKIEMTSTYMFHDNYAKQDL